MRLNRLPCEPPCYNEHGKHGAAPNEVRFVRETNDTDHTRGSDATG